MVHGERARHGDGARPLFFTSTFEGKKRLHHLHHRHFKIREGGKHSRPFDPDRLFCGDEVHCPHTAASRPSKPRPYGLRSLLNILATFPPISLVIVRSVSRAQLTYVNNYVAGFPVVFLRRNQLRNGAEL